MNRDPSLLRWMSALREGEATDAELLSAFHAQHDESSFEVLVRRHGPMVLGVCRRLLDHEQEAEDAFQATFLVLARRAGDIRQPEQLANWLWGVAYRAGQEVRKKRRRIREQQVTEMHEPEAAPAPESVSDLTAVLDQELKQLPEKYRTAVVLCDLEGCTREEAARRLGIPVGTLSGRLTTAHRKLAARLTRRGLAAGAIANLAVVLSAANTSAAVPAVLTSTTIQIGVRVAVGGLATSGASPAVAALVETVLHAIRMARWKSLGLMLIVSATILVPGVGLARQALQHPTEPPAPVVQASPELPVRPMQPDPRSLREVPIANDMKDIFVVSDLQESLPDFFRNNRLLVAEMPTPTVHKLAISTEPFLDIMLPINSANDPQPVQGGGRNVPVVPPSNAVRKLLEAACVNRASLNVIIRHEATAGLFDVVGYTTRTAKDFFDKADPVTRVGDVKQTDLKYAEPAKVELPSGPVQVAPGQPRLFRIGTHIRNPRVPNPIQDIILLSDRNESVVDFFHRNRVAVGCILSDDYEKLLRTKEPWLEIPVEPVSFNDEASALKRPSKTIRVARPMAIVEQQLIRPALKASPIKAMTVILCRNEPDAVFAIVGYPRYRTAFQFFEKDVRVGDTGMVTQKDLRYRPTEVK